MYEMLSNHVPRRTTRALVWIAALSFTAVTSAAQQARPIEPDDYYKIQRVGDSKLSPDRRESPIHRKERNRGSD